MVKSLLIILLLVSTNFALAQNGFFEIYSGKGQDRGESMVELSTGEFIIVGSTTSFYEAPPQMLLLKLDANGNRIWSKEYGGPEIDHGMRVEVFENDGIYLFGHSNNTDDGSYDVSVIKTDMDGEFIYNKTFPIAGNDFLVDQLTLPDSTFLLALKTSVLPDGLDDIVIVNMSREGSFGPILKYAHFGDDHFGDFQLLSDSTYAFAGSYFNEDSMQFKAFVTVRNFGGFEIWEKEYGEGGHFHINGLALDRDVIYAVGHQKDSLEDEEDVYTLRLDLDGNKLGGYVENSIGKRSFEEVTPFVTPGYFMLGFSRDDEFTFDGGEDVAYFEYDEWLNYQPFFLEVKGFGHDYFGDMITCSDSMVASVGSVSEYGQGDRSIYVFKIGANKVYPNIDYTNNNDLVSIIENANVGLLKVYPNPFEKDVRIEWNGESARVELITLQGQFAKSFEVNHTQSFDLSDLKSGIYLMRVNGKFVGRIQKL